MHTISVDSVYDMRPANERRRYIVTSSLIGSVYAQHSTWVTYMYLGLVHHRRTCHNIWRRYDIIKYMIDIDVGHDGAK